MAAKSPAAKKAKKAKPVKASKTTKSKSTFTSAQNQAFRAAYTATINQAQKQTRQNRTAAQRIQAAQALAKGRNRAIRRAQAKIVRSSYAQARYGSNANAQSFIVGRSSLRKAQSITAYLQARYGQKTYAITGKGSVRVFKTKRVIKGRVVSAGQASLSKAATNRIATRRGNAAAARLPSQAQVRAKATAQAKQRAAAKAKAAKARKTAGTKAKPKARTTSKVRKAPRHLKALPDTPWITAGNDEGVENCVAVAIANSLLYNFGYRVEDEQLELVKDNKLNRALWRVWHDEPWWPVDILRYSGTDEPVDGDIVGFETENGPHCGVLINHGTCVVSWGEVIPLESEIEEAWTLKWVMTG